MLIRFFFMLREGGVPASITEFLTLLEVMRRRIAGYSVDEFYYLSRACLVKDEALYDRFDRVFSAHFKGIQELFGEQQAEIPEEWLRRQLELMLSDEEKAQIEALEDGWSRASLQPAAGEDPRAALASRVSGAGLDLRELNLQVFSREELFLGITAQAAQQAASSA